MLINTFKGLARSAIQGTFLVDQLLSDNGWTYFVGEAGSGKTMLCIQLCAALEEGKDFLGMLTQQRHCLYLQADSGVGDWKTQIANLAPESSAFTAFDLDKGWLDRPTMRKLFHEMVWATYAKDSPQAGYLAEIPFNFVVFDSLSTMTVRDINTQANGHSIIADMEFICKKQLCKLCDGEVLEGVCTECKRIMPEEMITNKSIPFLLIHHPNSGPKRGTTAGSGSKVFGNVCSNMLTLSSAMLKLEKNRLVGNRELLLERLPTGAWTLASDGLGDLGF